MRAGSSGRSSGSEDPDDLAQAGSERIDAEVLAACPQLRAVCSMAVGYNNIDVVACTAHGVLVSNAPDVLT